MSDVAILITAFAGLAAAPGKEASAKWEPYFPT